MSELSIARLVQRLIADEQAPLVALTLDRSVVESNQSVAGLKERCRLALSELPAGGGLAVVFLSPETGMARLKRWLLLRFQLSAAARQIAANHAVVVSRYAIFPDLERATVVYELGTPAQRYAETHLIPRQPARALWCAVRALIARWSGCDPGVGAIVLVAQKR